MLSVQFQKCLGSNHVLIQIHKILIITYFLQIKQLREITMPITELSKQYNFINSCTALKEIS